MTNIIADIKAARAEIKKNINVVTLVSDELGPPPKTSGKDKFWCCPFHGENTPSMGVHEVIQIFKCFGCGRGGDAVAFIQELHGFSHVESIRYVANKYGIDISQYERPPTEAEKQKSRYIAICNEIADICSKELFTGSLLNWYIDDTGFSLEQVADYCVGHSQSTSSLISKLFLKFPNLSEDEVSALELNNPILWNNSLVYPIRSADGNVARFYNKPLSPPPDFGGKYVGTSTKHPLFSNGLLFGFNLARKQLRNNNYTIRIVEGQKAAIGASACAVMGTSIHLDQIATLKEYGVKKVIVGFDGDPSGRKASAEIKDNIAKYDGLNILIASFDDNMQPDVMAKLYGAAAVDSVFNAAVTPIEHFVNMRRKNGELSISDKTEIINDLHVYFTQVSDFHADISAVYLSKELGADIEHIKCFISDIKTAQSGLANKEAEQVVLKTLLLDTRQWPIVKQNITDHKAFTTSDAQYLYGAIKSTHDRALKNGLRPDDVTVQSIRDEIKIVFPHLTDLSKYVDTVLVADQKYQFNDALQKVVDLYKRRTGIDQSKLFLSSMRDLNKPTTQIISEFRRKLVSSIGIRKEEAGTPDRLAAIVEKELHERSLRTGSVIGHDFSKLIDVDGQEYSCLTGLTVALSGLQKQHQVIISANSGVGKSLISLQMATALSICPKPEDQVPILWIPLEMNEKELSMRIISFLTGIDNNRVQRADFTKEEGLRVKKALEMIARSQFYIKKPMSGTMDESYAIIDEYKFKYGLGGVFMDYIQLLVPGKDDEKLSTEALIGKASKMMKAQVAEAMDIVSVCISQQNRTNYEAGKLSSIEKVGGSYQISQDADDFIILVAKTAEQIQADPGKGNRKAFIDKRRGGKSDIIIDMFLDDSKRLHLRHQETLNPEQLIGLARGTGYEGKTGETFKINE